MKFKNFHAVVECNKISQVDFIINRYRKFFALPVIESTRDWIADKIEQNNSIGINICFQLEFRNDITAKVPYTDKIEFNYSLTSFYREEKMKIISFDEFIREVVNAKPVIGLEYYVIVPDEAGFILKHFKYSAKYKDLFFFCPFFEDFDEALEEISNMRIKENGRKV